MYACLISEGINGFFRDISLIRPWLESSSLDFELVIKISSLWYRMTNCYAEYYGNVYWWHYEPRDILDVISKESGNHPKVDELLTA